MSASRADSAFIARSIELAVQAGANGDRPFGAVFAAADGTVLAEGLNEVTSSGDVTAHAELVAIRHATNDGHAHRFAGSIMYASGEPCPMCAAACVWAGIARIVFAASTKGFSAFLTEGPHFTLGCVDLIGTTDARVVVTGPTDQDAALQAMRSAISDG